MTTQTLQQFIENSEWDQKEQKQEFEDIDNETDSSDEVEFYWDLFNIDLFDIIHQDLKSLRESKNNESDDNKTESIFLSIDVIEINEKQKSLKENGKILISNVYAKMFILYPQFDTFIAFDSVALTNYLNDIHHSTDIPIRGIPPIAKLYRGFNDIKGNKMRLSHNEEYITLCSHTSFSLYHISQFFTETNPRPIWQIIQEIGIILDFDWNVHSIFLVIEIKNKESDKHKYILAHYSLSGKYYEPPRHCGNVSLPPCVIMSIKLLPNNTFAVCLRNGLIIFYIYSNDGKYEPVHSIDISEHHKHSQKLSVVP
eukprot:319047_1